MSNLHEWSCHSWLIIVVPFHLQCFLFSPYFFLLQLDWWETSNTMLCIMRKCALFSCSQLNTRQMFSTSVISVVALAMNASCSAFFLTSFKCLQLSIFISSLFQRQVFLNFQTYDVDFLIYCFIVRNWILWNFIVFSVHCKFLLLIVSYINKQIHTCSSSTWLFLLYLLLRRKY